MEVRQRSIEGITPYQQNAKKHPKEQVEKIAASIKVFGFNQPIVVDKSGVIIAGHGRYLAAHLLGMKMVPTVDLDLTDEEAKAYRLADNKIAESEWDMGFVIPELRGLGVEMVKLTGFDINLLTPPNMQEEGEDKEDGCKRCTQIRMALDGHRRQTGHGADYKPAAEDSSFEIENESDDSI